MNERIRRAVNGLSMELLRRLEQQDENVMLSPLSAVLALGMALNGAEGKTEQELLNLFGEGATKEQVNQAVEDYLKALSEGGDVSFRSADSVWFPKNFTVLPEFLQKNREYYGAEVRTIPFDEQAVGIINGWVSEKTDHMIERIIDSISPEAVMYLINALVFEAEWETVYRIDQLGNLEFTDFDGTKHPVRGMFSRENSYIRGDGYRGFVKPYAGGRYSMMLLLPEEISLSELLRKMSGDELVQAFSSAENVPVETALPKFSASCSKILNDVLKELGVRKAFSSEAEFGALSPLPVSIGEVLQKTYIEVDERGTKAGAVTSVMMKCMACFEEGPEVILDRPFFYAVMDNREEIPLFTGTVVRLPESSEAGPEENFTFPEAVDAVPTRREENKARWWKRIFRKKR